MKSFIQFLTILTCVVAFLFANVAMAKKFRPCPKNSHHCKRHGWCCPKGSKLYCSYHKRLGRSHICGNINSPEIQKDALANCSSTEICK